MKKNVIIRIMGQNNGGGAERHIYQLNKFLIKTGWTVITYIPEPPFRNSISHCEMVDMNYIHNIKLLFLLKNIWQQRDKIVFIHSHLRNATVLAGFIAWIFRIPHVVTIHGLLSAGKENLRDIIFNFMVGFFLRRAHKVIFISHFAKKKALDQTRQKLSKINSAIVYNGSDDIMKSEHSKNKESSIFKICVVGALTDTKNMPDLIWLIERLHEGEIKKKIQLHVFGEGPWYEILQKKAFETKFLITHGYEANVDKIFNDIHLHIILCRQEGFGRVITETMARSIPTLCYNSGAFPELITNNYDGFLVGTKEELLKKLIEVIQNKSLLEKIAKNSRETFLKRFTVDKFLEATYAVLTSIINQNSKI